MNKIKVLFTGDFAPCRGFESIVLEKREKVLGEAQHLIASADLSFTNLECPLTTHNQAINKSGPALKANPACVAALKPFSVVGLANNHILDYGKQGLADTLEACAKVGLPTIGAGLNLQQARKPFIQVVNGVKVAIIAIAEYEFNQSENGGAGSAPIDLIDNYQQIQQARAQADVVIITLHGGNEYFPYPRPGLRKVCQHYIELGVEAVICHHPHVPGAYEYYQGKPIVYSLGNFIFDSTNPPQDWELAYMAQLNFSAETKQFESMELIPYKQSVELGGIVLLKNQEKADFLQRIVTYRQSLEDHQAWLRAWKNFVFDKADSFIFVQYFPFKFRGVGLLSRYLPISKFLFNPKNSLAKLNMLRCQSHRELLITALETKSQSRND